MALSTLPPHFKKAILIADTLHERQYLYYVVEHELVALKCQKALIANCFLALHLSLNVDVGKQLLSTRALNGAYRIVFFWREVNIAIHMLTLNN